MNRDGQWMEMEREISQLRRLAALAALAALTGLAVGVIALVWAYPTMRPAAPETAPADGELRVQRLVLVDEAGQERASLALHEQAPQLTFYSPDHRKVLVMGADPQGAKLHIGDAAGGNRIVLAYVAGMGPMLGLGDRKGTMRLLLAAPDEVGILVQMNDAEGRERLRMGLDTEGPMINMHDAGSRLRTEWNVDQRGPMLRLHDEEGLPVWMAP